MKKYIAEFLGTMLLVVIGCGVAVYTEADVVATSLAFGLSIVAIAYSFGCISGCHINPAVSTGLFLTGKMKSKDYVGYLVSQFLGGFAGALILGALYGSFSSLGANSANGNMIVALLVECILTFVFVSCVLFVTSDRDNSNIAGLVIGLTLTLVHLLGLGFTGTSVNPARSLGVAILQGGSALKDVWIFIIAPIAGAFLAAFLYNFMTKKK